MNALAFLSLTFLPVWAPAQDESDGPERDPAAVLERYRQYLERKPYADFAFDKMVEAAVQQNQLPALVAQYEEQVREEPEGRAARVVLGRLYTRTDLLDKALEQYQAVAEPDAELYLLVGELALRRSDWKAAEEALGTAAGLTTDQRLLTQIHGKRGEALLASGNRAGAVAAFRAVAELDPQNFHARLEVATQLARHGLQEEALAEFEAAEDLAGDDAARRCQVLAERGRLHERKLENEQAVAVYRQAIGLMARGNWLKRDLYEQVLSIHKRGGSLERLVEACQADVAAQPQDLDAREFLARVLREAGRGPEARAVLDAAVQDHPEDLKLSQGYIALLTGLKDTEAVIAEYQRILARRPGEMELYLELGQVFASEGRFEQAKLQWQRTLEKNLNDVNLCLRLAALYAYYGQPEEAIGLYEKAIALEPKVVDHYAELAAFLDAQERGAEVAALLERATTAAAGEAAALEQAANLWRERKDLARARVVLEQAVALRGDDARLLASLADLQVQLGDVEQGVATLHRVVNLAQEDALRRSAVDRVVRLFRTQGRVPELVEIETRAVADGAREAAPFLILAEVHAQERQPDLAVAVLEDFLARGGGVPEARVRLARLYEEQGDYDKALETYQALARDVPQDRRRWLKEMARIHLARYDQQQAFACYQEILRGAPDNAAAFKEVADAYRRLNLHDQAAECLEQAVRLEPEDGKYRLQLAQAYRGIGEYEKALGQVLSATRAKDEDLRQDARSQYYQLLTDLGRVESEAESLRARCDENPYDAEAPLLLADIYSRELEYELALELLDRLLAYQPKEPRLLAERARIRGQMDRHEEALADYETLWKLPDSDPAELSARILETAIAAGDLDRATTAAEGIRDAARVAGLFRKHKLLDQAEAALQRGAVLAPNDARLHFRLGELQRQMGKNEDAVASYERCLALGGDDWRAIAALGELQHELGRKEEVLRLGARLFSLVRLPQAEEEEDGEEEEAEEEVYYGYSVRSFYSAASAEQHYSEALNRIQQYYVDKGLKDEFVAAATAELELQPANAVLVQGLRNFLQYDKQDPDGAYAVALRALEAARRSSRTPARYTRRSWLDTLESWTSVSLTANNKIAAARLEELRPLPADASESMFLELATAEQALRDEDSARATLRAGLEAHPQSARLEEGLGFLLFLREDYAGAAERYQRVVALLESDPESAAEQRRRRELAYRMQRDSLLQSFPFQVRRRAGEQDLQRLYQLGEREALGAGWGLGRWPNVAGAKVRLAECRLRLGQRDAAVALLRSLEPEDPETLAALAALGDVYFRLELFPEAEAVYRRLQAAFLELQRDPLLSLVPGVIGRSAGPALLRLARIEERNSNLLEAYELYRMYGDSGAARLVLAGGGLYAAAEERFRERFAGAAAALAAVNDPFTRAEFRNSGVLLAEIYQEQRKWDSVLAQYQELARVLPDDFELRGVIARLHERAGRLDEAVAEHYAIIARKRELNRARLPEPEPQPYRITPEPPPVASTNNDDYAWSNLSSRHYSAAGARALHSVSDNYVAILRLLLDGKRTSQAAEVLRTLVREDVQTFRWLSWSFGEILDSYQFGAEGLPVLRLLHGYDPDSEQITVQYGRALLAKGRFEEAERTLTPLVHRGAPNDYYRSQAEELLQRLDAELGKTRDEGLDALAARVASDPKNVRNRMRLARAHFREADFRGALEHALAAEALAPHKEDVAALVDQCLRALGDTTLLEARLRQRLPSITDPQQKFGTQVELAELCLQRGDMDGVAAAFAGASEDVISGRSDFAQGKWYLRHGQYARALEVVRAETEQARRDPWYRERMESLLGRVCLMQGDARTLLDLLWARLEKAASLGEKTQVFQDMASALAAVPDPTRFEAAVLEAADTHGGLRGALYRAAYFLAVGDLERAEADLAGAARSAERPLYLYPLLDSIARVRGDLPQALAYLEEMAAVNPGSTSQTVSLPGGAVSEHDAVIAERGSLLLQLGRKEEALAAWDQLLDEGNLQTRAILAKLYREHDLFDLALSQYQGYLVKKGARAYVDFMEIAELYQELGDDAAAADAYEHALLFVAGQGSEQNRASLRRSLADCYRRWGRLEEHLERLQAQAAEDPDDVELLRATVQAATELGRDAIALASLERIAAKPGYEVPALRELADRYQSGGDAERAMQALEKLLQAGNVEEWNRSQYAKRLAELCQHNGRAERVIPILEASYGDAGAAAAQNEIGGILARYRRYEEALPYLKRASELNRDAWDDGGTYATALRELGRAREALEFLLARLRGPQDALRLMEWRERVLELADEIGADALWDAAAAAEPGKLQEAALLDLFRGRHDRAVQRFDAVLAAQPDNLAAACGALEACLRAARLDEALARGAAVARLARQYSHVHTDLEYFLQDLHTRLGAIHLRRDDPAAALACWQQRAAPQHLDSLWQYTYSNDYMGDWLPLGELLAARRRHAEALPYLWTAAMMEPSNRARACTYAWSLFQSGAEAAALDVLWRKVLDLSAAVAPNRAWTGGYAYYGDESSARPEHAMLLRMYRCMGRQDELLARTRAELERRPQHESLQALLDAALRDAGRHVERLRLVQEKLARSPEDRELQIVQSELLRRLGRHEEAAAILERLLPQLSAAAIPDGVARRAVRYGGAAAGSGVRFSWAGNRTSASSISYRYDDGGVAAQARTRVRRALMALHARLGRSESARALERQETELAGASSGWWWSEGRDEVLYSVLSAYAELDLDDEVARLCSLLLERDAERHAQRVADFQVAYYERRGDAARLEQARAAQLAELDRRRRLHPYSSGAQLDYGFALLRAGADLEAAAAAARRARELEPESMAAEALLGWAALRRGQAQDALAHLRRADSETEFSGRSDARVEYGLGLALAAAGARDEALPLLRRCLALYPEDPAAGEARRVLE
ncbi:MAG: tetratricopeptide repeat protein [Planctomycetota bacterium]|nr:MAG: tetratricopeptide repeat protein [Planctomycetota bacterium]